MSFDKRTFQNMLKYTFNITTVICYFSYECASRTSSWIGNYLFNMGICIDFNILLFFWCFYCYFHHFACFFLRHDFCILTCQSSESVKRLTRYSYCVRNPFWNSSYLFMCLTVDGVAASSLYDPLENQEWLYRLWLWFNFDY